MFEKLIIVFYLLQVLPPGSVMLWRKSHKSRQAYRLPTSVTTKQHVIETYQIIFLTATFEHSIDFARSLAGVEHCTNSFRCGVCVA